MLLPIASTAEVITTGLALFRPHRRRLTAALTLHIVAAIVGLTGPLLIGRLIDEINRGTATDGSLARTVAVLAGALTTQAVLIRFAQRQSMVLGETVFAQLREDLVRAVSRLPLGIVEQAGAGDLLSRATNDIESVSRTVRFGIPRILVAAVTALITTAAAVLTSPVLSPAVFAGVPLLVVAVRWYLRGAGTLYQRQLKSFAALSGSVNETVEAARTVEALGLAPVRRRDVDAAIRERRDSELSTLRLRSIFFPLTDLAFLLPIVVVVGWGSYLVSVGGASIGEVTAVALIATQLVGPVDELITWLDEIQVGTTALSRIIGVGQVPTHRRTTPARPADERIVAHEVHYAYRPGHEVVKGIELELQVGERLAIVGPSGSGKSTLARLLSGIDAPSTGTVTVGGVPLVDLPVSQLRTHVALVTQEHHLFVGSIAANLRLARPDATEDDIVSALRVVDAWPWVRSLPRGIEHLVGSGGSPLSPAQSQQLALARLLLLNPATVVLDEATSLIDPSSAREVERTMSAVLRGRTVVAIAHRLHTSRDADRIAVLDHGTLVELGSHDELLRLGGHYAALWESWSNDG